MTVQLYNYEPSEVRKLLEMNRQRGIRLLEGIFQSLFPTRSDDSEVEMKERLSNDKIFIMCKKKKLKAPP